MKIRNFLSRLQERAEDWLTIAGAVFISAMMVITAIDVTARKAFNHPLAGSYEIITLLFVTVVFLGLAYGQRRKAHINVDIFYGRFPPRVRHHLDGIVLLLSLAVMVILAWRSTINTAEAYHIGDVILGAIPIKTWPSRMVVPIGSGLMSLRLLVQIVEWARHREQPTSQTG